MPIAEVAGETAGRAALHEVAEAMETAEREGRVVHRIAIDRIDMGHVSRDRMVFDAAEMEELKASIADRGQQMPIEVMRHGPDYALISGARRLAALRDLGETTVLALVRRPESAAEAHVAMVEENEVRAALSFYERANLAVTSHQAGVFPDVSTAISTLFARAPAARRSKIARFVVLREALGRALNFPAAIPEKLGLKLAKAIEEDRAVARRISDTLRKTPPADAAAERRVLERALSGPGPAPKPAAQELAPGVRIETRAGRAVLSGAGVDDAFLGALRDWIVSHAKPENPSS